MNKVQPTEYSVLVVDDDPTMRLLLASVLGGEGFQVREASDGIDATRILTQHSVDVIVADFNMPGMDGLSLLRHARLSRPSAARIMLTGKASLETAVQAINESEVFRFLIKPVEPADLVRHVCSACARVALERELILLRKAAQEQDKLLDCLEKATPGITQVERRSDGALVLDSSYLDENADDTDQS